MVEVQKPPTFVSTQKEKHFSNNLKITPMRKSILILAIGLLVGAATLEAQGRKEGRGHRGNPAMCDSVAKNGGPLCINTLPNITEDQKKAIDAILNDFKVKATLLAKELKENRIKKSELLASQDVVSEEYKNLVMNSNNAKQKIEILKAEELVAIKAKLTPEQKIEFNKRIKEMGNKRFMHKQYKMHDNKDGKWNKPYCPQRNEEIETEIL